MQACRPGCHCPDRGGSTRGYWRPRLRAHRRQDSALWAQRCSWTRLCSMSSAMLFMRMLSRLRSSTSRGSRRGGMLWTRMLLAGSWENWRSPTYTTASRQACFLSSDAAILGRITATRQGSAPQHFKEIADSIGLYAGVALGAAMRRVKSNHTCLDTAFAAEQAKSQLLKTGLGIICAFDSDLSFALKQDLQP